MMILGGASEKSKHDYYVCYDVLGTEMLLLVGSPLYHFIGEKMKLNDETRLVHFWKT